MADREKNFKNVLAVQKLLTKDEWESITSDMKGKTADKCKPLISEKLQAIGKNEQLEQIIAMLDKNKIDDFIGLNQVFGVAKQFFEKTDRFIEKMQNSVRQDLVNQAPEIGLKSPPHSRVGSMIGILPRARSSGRESASSLTRDSSVEGKSGSLLHSPSDASQSLGITASANDAIQPEPRSPAAVPRSVSQNVSSSDSSAMNARSPAPAGSSPAKFQLSRAKAAGRSSSAVIEEVLHQNSSSPRSSVSSEPRSPIAFIKDQLSQVGQNFDIGHAEYWVSAINAEIKGFRSPQTIDIVKMVKAYIEECKKNDPSLDVQALLDTINPFIPATSAKSPAEPVRGNPTEAGASQRDAVTASPPPPRKGLPPTPADIEQGASVGTPGIRRGRGDNKQD